MGLSYVCFLAGFVVYLAALLPRSLALSTKYVTVGRKTFPLMVFHPVKT